MLRYLILIAWLGVTGLIYLAHRHLYTPPLVVTTQGAGARLEDALRRSDREFREGLPVLTCPMFRQDPRYRPRICSNSQ